MTVIEKRGLSVSMGHWTLVVLLFALGFSSGRAQAPDSIAFQGFLTEPGGTPLNAVVSITFKLYKGGGEVWSETQPSVNVTGGTFNVLLGSVTPLEGIAFDRPIELGIKVGADPEIVPRTPLVAAAFALGLRGMYTVWAADASRKGYNVIGGSPVNSVAAGAVGATISGGGGTNLAGTSSFPNQVSGDFGTVGGGSGNTASSFGATVSGGGSNVASAGNATVGGGDDNTASGSESTVSGGENNMAGGVSATVSGGENNTASGNTSTVGGGLDNVADGDNATIAGGTNNTTPSQYATVSGGSNNDATHEGAVVGGGSDNTATGKWSTISGGARNFNNSQGATVGGGTDNRIVGDYATIAGGDNNKIDNNYATIGGGVSNVADGMRSTVPGGQSNRASGYTSFAAGYKAKADHPGTFVWNDRSVQIGNDSLVSTGDNQFLIRAVGGVGIGTTSPITQLHVRESINSTASAANHVALIDNSSTGTSADVLALRIARTTSPETTNVFVSFLHSGTAAGVIRGNGSGGVELLSSGSDYAELLERIDPSEPMEEGDVVAVTSGRISRRGQTPERYMVVSHRPIVLGNMQDPEREHLYERIAFIGQVPVKVKGPVRAGDFLVPSGEEDGSAVAVSPGDLRSADLNRIAAVAWESSDDPSLKKIVSEVGLDRSAAVQMALQNELAELRTMIRMCQPAVVESRLTGFSAVETGAGWPVD